MFTAQEIKIMSDEDKLQVFNKLAEQTWNTERYGTKFCEATGTASSTLANWRGGIAPVPIWAILLLIEWSREKTTDEQILAMLATSAQHFAKAATELNKAVMLGRSSLVPGGTGAPGVRAGRGE